MNMERLIRSQNAFTYTKYSSFSFKKPRFYKVKLELERSIFIRGCTYPWNGSFRGWNTFPQKGGGIKLRWVYFYQVGYITIARIQGGMGFVNISSKTAAKGYFFQMQTHTSSVCRISGINAFPSKTSIEISGKVNGEKCSS